MTSSSCIGGSRLDGQRITLPPLLVDVLRCRNALFSAYTLTRGAVEAAALGCYLKPRRG